MTRSQIEDGQTPLAALIAANRGQQMGDNEPEETARMEQMQAADKPKGAQFPLFTDCASI